MKYKYEPFFTVLFIKRIKKLSENFKFKVKTLTRIHDHRLTSSPLEIQAGRLWMDGRFHADP